MSAQFICVVSMSFINFEYILIWKILQLLIGTEVQLIDKLDNFN